MHTVTVLKDKEHTQFCLELILKKVIKFECCPFLEKEQLTEHHEAAGRTRTAPTQYTC